MPEVAEQINRTHYIDDIEKMRMVPSPQWLKDLREGGVEDFENLEFPNHKTEGWTSTVVSPIVKTAFESRVGASPMTVSKDDVASHLFDEPDWTQLVFVDGFLAPNLSRMPEATNGVQISSLAEAIAAGDACVERHLDKVATHSNAFIALNAAFVQDGAFLHVSKNADLVHPVHFLFVSTGEARAATYPRNLFVLGECAHAKVIQTYVGLADDKVYLTNAVTEVVLEANARLETHKVVHEGGSGYHLEAMRVHQLRDSRFESYTINLAGQIARNGLEVLLDGEGANCHLNGLYLNDGNRIIDNALFVEHISSNCYSRMGYKGILDNTSEANFTGKVYVRPDAQRTDSDQLNNNLLLADTAKIDTRPQLEIFADDVKCTHGATIGSFPDELIFYFRSRGMSERKARGILTYGFGDAVVDEITINALKSRLSTYIFEKYSPV